MASGSSRYGHLILQEEKSIVPKFSMELNQLKANKSLVWCLHKRSQSLACGQCSGLQAVPAVSSGGGGEPSVLPPPCLARVSPLSKSQ